MKIGIMAAVLKEASTLVSHFENVSVQEFGGRQFFLGTWHNHEIVLAFSRWGKVAAATIATALINKFEVEKLIFTGLAGAAANHLEIGDVVISESLFQQAILQEVPKALAVEMEGAAVAQVCADYQIPFVVIRTISDKADHTSVINFSKFNDEVARHYAEYIVDAMLESMH